MTDLPATVEIREEGPREGFQIEPGPIPTDRKVALIDALAEEGRRRGWSVIRWITADDNYRARTSYDRMAVRTMWVTYDRKIQPA